MTGKITEAARFAFLTHRNQRRKWGLEQQYAQHLATVAGRTAMLVNADEDMVCAAFLHDTIEDTLTTASILDSLFGHRVAELVVWLTNTSKLTHPDANRAERKKLDRERIEKAPVSAKQIKMLDRIDNLCGTYQLAPPDFERVYIEESLLLVDAIGHADAELRKELLGLLVAARDEWRQIHGDDSKICRKVRGGDCSSVA